MKQGQRKGDMPSDEEIMRSQLYAVAHGVKLHRNLVEVVVESCGEEFVYEVQEVVDGTSELHPKVILKVRFYGRREHKERNSTAGPAQATRSEDQADGQEHGEGAVRNE